MVEYEDWGGSLDKLIVLRGGGDISSGIAHRLAMCGFRVMLLEIGWPTVIRRGAAFATAVFEGSTVIEGITAFHVKDCEEALDRLNSGQLAVLVDPEGKSIPRLKPFALVDCILAKRNLGTNLEMAPVVIGLGPGFEAPIDVHAVVETNRGHNLGRVLYRGAAQKDTGVPGEIMGYSSERIIRSPKDGVVSNALRIGDKVKAGDLICMVDHMPVFAPIDGVLRGMIYPGSKAYKGMKIGDVDPRGEVLYCTTISDKARSIAGGVLEALLYLSRQYK